MALQNKSIFQAPNVIVFGGIMCDIYLNCTQEVLPHLFSKTNPELFILEEGTKTELTSIECCVGGGGANVACSLAHLGLPTTLFSKIGSDHLGTLALNTLGKKQIDLSLCATSKTIETGTSFILPSEKGNHAILVFRGANASVQKDDIPFSAFKKFNGVYIASLSGSFAHCLPDIATHAKTTGSLIMHNPSTSEIKNSKEALLKAFKALDILIMNQTEARLLFSTFISSEIPFSLAQLYSYLANQGPQIVIVTSGKDGAYCYTPQEVLYQPCIATNVINTVGAGDIFGATFFGALILGHSYRESLLFAAHNSAYALAATDQNSRLLNFSELSARLKK